MPDLIEFDVFCAYPAVLPRSPFAAEAAVQVALPAAVVAAPTPTTAVPGANVGQKACIAVPVAVVKPPIDVVALPTFRAVSAPCLFFCVVV